MTTISIDIQPQYRFSCAAANEKYFLHQPESIVDELNRQAVFADKRLLIENVSTPTGILCQHCIEAPLYQSGFVFNKIEKHCRSQQLLEGLPRPADYDDIIQTDGDYRHGVCFHDACEVRSTGLIEWLHRHQADTVILGGLSTEETITNTAQQLLFYNNNLHIIVNLSACCGYTPESTLTAIKTMRQMGITVITHSAAIPTFSTDFALHTLKVS